MKARIEQALQAAVETLWREAGQDGEPPAVRLEQPKRAEHGDWASAIALQLAGRLGRPPREIAERIQALGAWPPEVEAVEIAGPGFLNFRIAKGAQFSVLKEALADAAFGMPNLGRGRRVCLEFVSANPTGPLHVGHGRGAVVGDALARILAAAGWDVHREYYINDAGRQVEILADTLWWRMGELAGAPIPEPEEAYRGEYVKEIARDALAEKPFAAWAEMEERARKEKLARFAVDWNMREIRATLDMLGIAFDAYISERALHEQGAVQKAVDKLRALGLAEEAELPPPKGKPQDDWLPGKLLVFRATRFGDDADRPLLRADGAPTYFAADVAYHAHKLARGFVRLINVWGADHGGYVRRVQAAVEALSGRKGTPEVVLVQMVSVVRAGEPVRMSKRAGNFVELRDVLEEVGADAVRFHFLARRAETQFAFDLELAKAQSEDNPVYYAQYAHARCASIFRRAEEMGVRLPERWDAVDTSPLGAPEEEAIAKRIAAWPEVFARAAERLEPHRIANWALELAADFHAFYHEHRVIVEDEKATMARLLLVAAVKTMLARALGLLGVSAPERM